METMNEAQLKDILKISDWNKLSGHSVLKYIKLLPNIEKSLHLKVLEQTPEFLKKAVGVVDIIKTVISDNEKLSTETKQSYDKIISVLNDMLKKENLSEDEHDKIYEELVKVASFMNTTNKREEEFLEKVMDNIFKTAIVAVVLVGIFFGGKSILASMV